MLTDRQHGCPRFKERCDAKDVVFLLNVAKVADEYGTEAGDEML